MISTSTIHLATYTNAIPKLHHHRKMKVDNKSQCISYYDDDNSNRLITTQQAQLSTERPTFCSSAW